MCLYNPLAVYVPTVLRLIDLGLRFSWTLLYFFNFFFIPYFFTQVHSIEKQYFSLLPWQLDFDFFPLHQNWNFTWNDE